MACAYGVISRGPYNAQAHVQGTRRIVPPEIFLTEPRSASSGGLYVVSLGCARLSVMICPLLESARPAACQCGVDVASGITHVIDLQPVDIRPPILIHGVGDLSVQQTPVLVQHQRRAVQRPNDNGRRSFLPQRLCLVKVRVRRRPSLGDTYRVNQGNKPGLANINRIVDQWTQATLRKSLWA